MSTVEHLLISDIFSVGVLLLFSRRSLESNHEVHRSVIVHLLSRLVSSMCSTSNPSIILEQVSIDSILCSIESCKTIYDVFCFHCRTNFCSNHFSQHEQQRSKSDDFQRDIDDLLALTSSKSFSITTKKSSKKNFRRKFSNPFVSSKFLIEKMKENYSKRDISYNLRKRPRRHFLRTRKNVKICQKLIQNRSTNETKFCRRKLPCPYHSS